MEQHNAFHCINLQNVKSRAFIKVSVKTVVTMCSLVGGYQ